MRSCEGFGGVLNCSWIRLSSLAIPLRLIPLPMPANFFSDRVWLWSGCSAANSGVWESLDFATNGVAAARNAAVTESASLVNLYFEWYIIRAADVCCEYLAVSIKDIIFHLY